MYSDTTPRASRVHVATHSSTEPSRALCSSSDFRGEHRTWYNMLSASDISVNAWFFHDSFRSSLSKMTVHGSWVRSVACRVKLPSGSTLLMSFHAARPHEALYAMRCATCSSRPPRAARATRTRAVTPFLTPFSNPFTTSFRSLGGWCRGRDGAILSSPRTLKDAEPTQSFENVRVTLLKRTLKLVVLGAWQVEAKSTISYPHQNRLRMNLKIRPLQPTAVLGPVAPHGTPLPLPHALFGRHATRATPLRRLPTAQRPP